VLKEIKEIEAKSTFQRIKSFFKHDEVGATAVEYGLLVGLIAVVILAAVTTLGSVVSDKFNETQCEISGKTWTAATKTCA
jgi:pilus assembly protein Flp/PilA